jgi:hypothetical protein
MRSSRWFSILVAVLVGACATDGAAEPSPSGPGPSPTTDGSGSFTLDVLPAEEPTAIRMAIPGSKYCFLVVVDDAAGSGSPVTIDATATRASVASIEPRELAPGVVGEIWVVADPATSEVSGVLTVSGIRDGSSATVTRTIAVFPMADERAVDAQPHFERWVAWLAAERPELGIDADTGWEPVFVSTLLVVSHYSYWSDEWEMTIAWHNMIAPDDWADVFLRHRGTETTPSIAFRIDSVSGATVPHPIQPPTELVR